MDQETGKQLCAIVSGVLISDGVIAPSEARFLKRLRTRFQVPNTTIVEPCTSHEEAIATLQGLPQDVRDEAVSLIVKAAAVDGQIAIGERIFISGIARALEIQEADLEKRLDAALAEEKAQPFELAASLDGS